MTRILYASAYGSTRAYAEELARRLDSTAERIDDVDPATLPGSEALIVLSYVHGPRLPAARFLAEHNLGDRPLAAVAVSMARPENARREDQIRTLLGPFAAQVERFYLPGRMHYSELSDEHHAMMRTIVTMLQMKPGQTDNDREMVGSFNTDLDRVDFAALDPVVAWARAQEPAPEQDH
ncbi:MAG TPA: flavodoxin domain-containing protein [Corynebacterium sp.]|nr:flavodoxin domain-containing protein [Corynebacterium sp.]